MIKPGVAILAGLMYSLSTARTVPGTTCNSLTYRVDEMKKSLEPLIFFAVLLALSGCRYIEDRNKDFLDMFDIKLGLFQTYLNK